MNKKHIVPYTMLAPFFILFVGFFIYPFLYSCYLSLFAPRMGKNQFVDLSNYTTALGDTAFWKALLTVVCYGFLQAFAVLLVGLILALLLDSPAIKGKAFFRLVYFLPYAVPGIIAAIMWGFLYSPQLDPLLGVFSLFNGGNPVDILSIKNLVYLIVNIVTWEMAGYNMTMYFASLTSLPLELYEAAKIDGCNEFRIAIKIKIPLLKPMIIFTSILSIIGSLQLFNEPFVLSNLASVPPEYTPNMYIYNMAFTYGDVNYSATLSFLLAFVTVLISLVFLYATSQEQRRDRKRQKLMRRSTVSTSSYSDNSSFAEVE